MNLSKIFDVDLVKVGMSAATKEEAIDQLVDLFCEKYPDKSKSAIMEAVTERERLGNTSMGRGVAFPHARTDIVTGLYAAIGILPEGIKGGTPDKKPLQLVVLLLTPRNISKNYLQTLSGLASFTRRLETLPALLSAKTAGDVIAVIDKTEIEVRKILTVGDVMTPDPVTITPDKTLKDVANILFEKKISCLPVVDDNNALVGEITGIELLKFAMPNYKSFIANIANIPEIESFEELLHKEHSARVSNFMKINPVVVERDAPVIEAAALMLFKKAELVSVLDDGKLVGVITKTDIVSKIVRG
jgi:mannitol/fructose-specific phosphotransferase system IIA component (Ntr-type)